MTLTLEKDKEKMLRHWDVIRKMTAMTLHYQGPQLVLVREPYFAMVIKSRPTFMEYILSFIFIPVFSAGSRGQQPQEDSKYLTVFSNLIYCCSGSTPRRHKARLEM